MKLGNEIKLLVVICMVGLFLLGGLFRVVSDLQPTHVSTNDGTWVQEGGDTLDWVKGLEGKCTALTFDDGLHKDCMPQLLDGLKKRGVRATFFLMGQNTEGNEDLVKCMKEEGHLMGNYSYSHVQLTRAGSAAMCQAVDRISRMIEDIMGERPKYMCPPLGDWNEELKCEVGMTMVLWSVDSLDWKLGNRNKTVKRVLKDVEDGGIILMHDIFPASVDAAPKLVDTLTKQEYTFATVDKLLIGQHCIVQAQVRRNKRMRRNTAEGAG